MLPIAPETTASRKGHGARLENQFEEKDMNLNSTRFGILKNVCSVVCVALFGLAPVVFSAPDVSYMIETVDIVEQPSAFDYPGQSVSPVAHDRMVYEKNVEIEVRDGTILRANVFRPAEEGLQLPTLIAMTVYVKDIRLEGEALHEIEQAGNYLTHELPNPDFWVGRGYNVVWVDTRGAGASNGRADVFSDQEALDYHDAIEWVAEQPWSDGKVASTGISYMAIIQWIMASTQPPHLAAMIPWEGADDNYLMTHHGGIPNDGFISPWFERTSGPRQPEHPEGLAGEDRFVPWGPGALGTELDGPFFENYTGDHSRIAVPLLSAGNWGGAGLHHPGNIDGFVAAASEHKILSMHEGTHIGPYYSAEGTLLQLRFLDHFLKGMDTGIQDEPPVRLAIMSGFNDYTVRLENEWPLARTQWTPYYLNAASSGVIEGVQLDGTLTLEAPRAEAAVTYSAEALGKHFGVGGPGVRTQIDREIWPYNWADAVTFVTEPMAEDTEFTGPVKLKMWVSSSIDDMDIFATIRNIDPDGNESMIFGSAGPDASIGKGWLRASMRKLDPSCATADYQPCLPYDEKQPLTPGEIVPVEVRINPIGAVFKEGHRLMLDIQTGDSPGGRGGFTHNNAAHRVGENTIHVGGDRASYLLLPLIPSS